MSIWIGLSRSSNYQDEILNTQISRSKTMVIIGICSHILKKLEIFPNK